MNIPQIFTYFLAMILCLSFHEFAHAWTARLRGDDTAERMGRLTVNPMAHLDWIGTVILPLVGAIMKWPMLGWAKPVPVDPRRFANPRLDHALVAFAGPASNVVMGFLCALAVALYARFLSESVPPGSFFFPIVGLLQTMIVINGILAVFNMIPLPPLDGSAILSLLLPDEWAARYEEIVGPYGFAILLMLLMTGSLGWISSLMGVYTSVVSNAAFGLVFMGA